MASLGTQASSSRVSTNCDYGYYVWTGQKKNTLVDVGTGAGKTLCMVLPCMLAPDTMAIIFSPLKQLQAVQVLVFSQYQIKAIAINEDTPNDPHLWKVCGYIYLSFVFVIGTGL